MMERGAWRREVLNCRLCVHVHTSANFKLLMCHRQELGPYTVRWLPQSSKPGAHREATCLDARSLYCSLCPAPAEDAKAQSTTVRKPRARGVTLDAAAGRLPEAAWLLPASLPPKASQSHRKEGAGAGPRPGNFLSLAVAAI